MSELCPGDIATSGAIGRFRRVVKCWIFQAHGPRVNPATALPGREVVELILGGKVIFDDGSGEKIYGSGSIFWHSAGEKTVCLSPPGEPYRCLAINFEVDPASPRPCGRTGHWNAATAPELFAADALSCFEHWPESGRELLTAYIASTLLRQMSTGNAPALPPVLQQACIIIEQNPAAELDIASLARSCGVSKPHLFNLFRRYLHRSPYRYMMDQRLKMARHLLIEQDMPIKSISGSCGFKSLEIFYRHFRRSEGMAPGEYRRKHKCR